VEHAVVGVAESFCDHIHGVVVSVLQALAWNPSPHDMDVCLLAALEDAQILIHGAEISDHPGRTRRGAMLGAIPAGPAFAFGWAVGGSIDGKHAVPKLSRESGGLLGRQRSR
jgi:hypothetical protein